MSKESIAAAVSRLILPTVEELGYLLWDVVYAKEGADYHLTVTIDSEDGITIDDCERVHRAIDPILDEADPIEESYYLNVSSPGIERELRTEAHLLASIGEKCEAKLYAPLAGKRTVVGILTAADKGQIILATDGGEVTLALSAVAKIKTVFFD